MGSPPEEPGSDAFRPPVEPEDREASRPDSRPPRTPSDAPQSERSWDAPQHRPGWGAPQPEQRWNVGQTPEQGWGAGQTPEQGWGAGPPQPQNWATVPQASGKATASLVLGICGIVVCPIVLSIIGLVLGTQARREIKASGGALTGEGNAKAGVVLGWVGLGLWAAVIVIYVIAIVAIGVGSQEFLTEQ